MTQVWRFGRFELQPAQRRLLADGRPLELGARALDLLATLVEHAGALVSKDELLDRVWADAVVEEANLHVQVSALRKLLGRDAIATVPGRGYQFVLPLATGSAAPPATTPPAPDAGLPPLLGRDEDLARVAQALARGGFVTVTGAGGSGKTLLARHLVARHGTVDGSPAAWVDLVELDAAPAVVPAVAAALQVHGPPRDAAALAQALAAERRLLVLDNAEHLLDTVGGLADALRAQASGLALLVTSQAPLHRRGEVVHALAGLPVPAPPCTADEALRHAAVALFVAHAKQADRRFRFGDTQVEDVVAICASLGGSALGVQLAAALLGQMTLAAVRERLARETTGPDDAAIDPSSNVLRSALSWSHDLLSPAARRVFRRLAVAQGPLPLDLVLAAASDASAAGDAGDEAADALADLVERSLVQCEPAPDAPPEAPPRYRLLEAPRALALEQLHAAGERGKALARLARALAPLGDALHEVDWGGREEPGRDAALRARQPVAADIVAAFEAALTMPGAEGAATSARLAELLVRAVLARPAAERLRWAQALRERADAAGLPRDLRARALDAAASLIRHSDLAARRAVLLLAAAAWREAGDTLGEYRALARAAEAAALGGRHDEAATLLARVRELDDPAWSQGRRRWRWFAEGVVAVCAGDQPRAMQAWRQQLELVRGWQGDRAQALHSLANAEQIGGDAAAALPRLLEGAAIARHIRSHAMLHGFMLPNLVAAHVALGDLGAARSAAAEGWPHARTQDAEAWWADHLALLAAHEGRPRTAARLLGLADAGYARLKDGRQALEQQSAAAAEAAARAALGDAAFDALRAEGREPAAEAAVGAAALAAADGPPALTA